MGKVARRGGVSPMIYSAGNAVNVCWWVLLILLAVLAACCRFKVRRLRAPLRMFEEVSDTMMQNTQGLILNVHSIASRLPQTTPCAKASRPS